MSLEHARRVLEIEAQAVADLIPRLDEHFSAAVEILFGCTGKVVVSGMGKSGLIGQKISSTLASTGTPAFFIHPADGVHGDLGMVRQGDAFLAISNSGETEELLKLLPFMKRLSIPIIALTGKRHSTLAKYSEAILDVSVREEACPMGLAPTASTTATLAMGDALAMTLLEKRGFKQDDFAQYHPGGTLGRKLLLRVQDLMHQGEALPRVSPEMTIHEAILEITSKKLGMTTVMDGDGHVVGVITDGDLRRTLERGVDLAVATAGEIATPHPKTIGPGELAARAVHVMETFSITSLVVVDEAAHIIGVIHLHDLLKSGVV